MTQNGRKAEKTFASTSTTGWICMACISYQEATREQCSVCGNFAPSPPPPSLTTTTNKNNINTTTTTKTRGGYNPFLDEDLSIPSPTTIPSNITR